MNSDMKIQSGFLNVVQLRKVYALVCKVGCYRSAIGSRFGLVSFMAVGVFS